jgi:NAD(P)-dependent dehydrogenase (short-subunit alcohol dehydrogenase family)
MTMPGNRAASNSPVLAGRVALITGASGGIGQALGRRLAAAGARLALAYGANFGRILFVSSVAAFTGGSVGPHYAASKAGLHGLTHYLAVRLARSGITVNALAPALITGTAMLPGDPEELRARIPVGRLGRPEEVADLAIAVLGNAYLTNQVIGLDGGMYPR